MSCLPATSTTCSDCSLLAELATTSAPTFGSLISVSIISSTVSLLAWPVMSAGFPAHPKPSRISLMVSLASSDSSGRSRPSCPNASAVREQTPPECEITAIPGFDGAGLSASICETSKSWSQSETRVTPCCLNAALYAASSPVSDAVWACAARAPRPERPIFINTIGLPFWAASRQTSRNFLASLNPSTNIAITLVSSSSRRYRAKSEASRSASLPVEIM